jgi:hypothetical protein
VLLGDDKPVGYIFITQWLVQCYSEGHRHAHAAETLGDGCIMVRQCVQQCSSLDSASCALLSGFWPVQEHAHAAAILGWLQEVRQSA